MPDLCLARRVQPQCPLEAHMVTPVLHLADNLFVNDLPVRFLTSGLTTPEFDSLWEEIKSKLFYSTFINEFIDQLIPEFGQES